MKPSTSAADTSSAAATAATKPEATLPPSGPKVNDDPGQLIGMNGGGLMGMLGAPNFVRRDAPAQLWRYRNGGCILDLFLYANQEASGGSLNVRYYEARSLSHTHTTARACLRALLLARGKQEAG